MTQDTQPASTVNAVAISQGDSTRTGWIAAGGVIGALAASSCCVLPLVLLSLGVSGAWMSKLTVLAPYKTYIAGGTLVLLGCGYYLTYVKPTRVCVDGSCALPLPNRLVTSSLWVATALVITALGFDYVVPLLVQ